MQVMLNFINHMLYLVLILSMPPILVAAIIGTLVSLLQALTQVQDQTLSFAIKLTAVMIVIFLTSAWFGSQIYDFAISSFTLIRKL